MGEYFNGKPSWFSPGLTNPKVSITVITSGSQIFPFLRLSVSQTAGDNLARVGVVVIKNVRVESVASAGAGSSNSSLITKTTVKLSDGNTLEAGIYVLSTVPVQTLVISTKQF